MQKPLIILASSRKKSDTKDFVDKVFEGRDHNLVDLLDFNISPFDYDGNYPDTDEFLRIANEMLKHKVIVFATPVYWYAMSGLLKNFFDRFTDIVTIKKQIGRKMKGKSTFLLAVGAEKNLPYGFEMPFKSTSEYLKMNFAGRIYHSASKPIPKKRMNNEIKIFISKINNSLTGKI